MLTKGVADYLQNSGFQTRGRLWLWVTIYFNKKGLHDTLVNNRHCTSEQFEGFLLGFSQASPRFLIADVGFGKEAADVKIKGTLTASLYLEIFAPKVLTFDSQNICKHTLAFRKL